MPDATEELRGDVLAAAPSRNPASSRPSSFGSIVRGERTREGDGDPGGAFGSDEPDGPSGPGESRAFGRRAGRRPPLAPRRAPP